MNAVLVILMTFARIIQINAFAMIDIMTMAFKFVFLVTIVGKKNLLN